MWLLTIRSPAREPYEYILEPGRNTIGRKSGNAIQILDQSASREHAEIDYDPDTNTLLIKDLGSSNGTFVNRERITEPQPLHPEDQIRIGQYVIALTVRGDETHALVSAPLPSTTQPFTRDLLLESIDQHAILLYEVAGRLNRVIDLHLALREVWELMRLAMGADRCEVILVEHLDRLPQLGFPTSLAHEVVGQRLAVHIPDIATYPNPDLIKTAALLGVRSVLCIPVMTGDQVTAIIYAYKTQAHRRPFDRRDMPLAVAISHQAALTIERTRLHDQTERRLKHVQALRAIDQAIAGSVDLRMTLNILLQHIVSQLQIDAVVVLLYNPYTNLLEYTAGQGFRTSSLSERKTALHIKLIQRRFSALSAGMRPVSLSPAEGFLAFRRCFSGSRRAETSPHAGHNTWRRFRLKAKQTKHHSPVAALKPRNENCRNPKTSLIMPITGSM